MCRSVLTVYGQCRILRSPCSVLLLHTFEKLSPDKWVPADSKRNLQNCKRYASCHPNHELTKTLFWNEGQFCTTVVKYTKAVVKCEASSRANDSFGFIVEVWAKGNIWYFSTWRISTQCHGSSWNGHVILIYWYVFTGMFLLFVSWWPARNGLYGD